MEPRKLALKKYNSINNEKRRLLAAKWRTKNPELAKEVARRSRAKSALLYPERRAASGAVRTAVQRGRLTRQPCKYCGATPAHGHHNSYAKENRLNVEWMCQKHHAAWHKIFLVEN